MVAWGAALKVVMIALLGASLCGFWIATLFWAYGAGAQAAAKQKMRQYGIHDGMLPLYRRAAKLINRLAQLTDLDGALAGDQLSPDTRKLVTDWVTDYKKEIEKP